MNRICEECVRENPSIQCDKKLSHNSVKWVTDLLMPSRISSLNGEPYQDAPLGCTAHTIFLKWGRRLGKSQVLANKALEQAFNKKDFDVLYISPYRRSSTDNHSRMIQKVLVNKDIYYETTCLNKSHIAFKNGSTIKSLFTEKSLRGLTVDLCILDEVGDMRKEVLETVKKMRQENPGMLILAAGTGGTVPPLFTSPSTKTFQRSSEHSPDWDASKTSEVRQVLGNEMFIKEILAQ